MNKTRATRLMRGDSESSAEETMAGFDGVLSLLSAIVDSSHDAIVSKTLDGIITSWNSAAERMFGYTANEAIGQSIRLIIPSELQAEEDYVLDQIRRGEKVDHFETIRQTKDGRRLNISLTVSPVRDSRGTVIGASKIARDVTGQKEMEREREETRRQLAEALAGRDEFIAIAAHELRNPLNALSLLWRLVERTSAAGNRSLIEKSRAQLGRLSSLVDRLLDVTRIRSGSFDLYPECFDLVSLIKEVVSRLTIENPGIPIVQQLAPRIEGTWDRLRIDQVVSNLVSNAIKFGKKKPVTISASADGSHATIAVRDEGIGILPENLSRIFERFERITDRSRNEGLGMGLWIAKEIAKAHGGGVEVESELGKGSTFVVRLPLSGLREGARPSQS